MAGGLHVAMNRELASDSALHVKETAPSKLATPSAMYRADIWRLGLWLGRVLPTGLGEWLAGIAGFIYSQLFWRRREVVVQNLLPVFAGNRNAAQTAARKLFQEFAIKVMHLWRFESGRSVEKSLVGWSGWEIFETSQARGKGVLLVTPHLGNWEFGGAFMRKRDMKLLVLTQAEPQQALTELRKNSRSHWGIETFVVGQDPFAFVEIIKRLQDGAVIALLADRPPASTGVEIELFGKPFRASNAAAELARASGCAIVPCYVLREDEGYRAHFLPEINYDRAAIGDRKARIKVTQEIMKTLEPAIRENATQWYHFIPIWS
jgi:lauroyl/myristoyl acyltransferase